MTNELLHSLLAEIGLSRNETVVYLTVLHHNPISYNKVAELTKLNRTTCYAVAKQLIKQELLVEDLGTPVTQLLAKPPEALIAQLEKEQASVVKKLELAKRAVYELDKIIPQKTQTEPRLTYIEEERILDFLYKRADKWMESAHQFGSTVWGFESAQFETGYKEWISWYWQQPRSENLTLKLFSDDAIVRKTAAATGPGTGEFLLIPDIDFTTDIWIYGNYLVLLSLETHPHYLIELKEPLLAQNLRQFLQALWKATEPQWDKTTKHQK